MNSKTLLTFSAVLIAASVYAQDTPLAASPRAREQFPELTRVPQTSSAKSDRVLSTIKANVAFARSPRIREEFPELDRPALASQSVSRPVIENRAWAASPRAKEEFPWLARENVQTKPAFEVAPVK